VTDKPSAREILADARYDAERSTVTYQPAGPGTPGWRYHGPIDPDGHNVMRSNWDGSEVRFKIVGDCLIPVEDLPPSKGR
jgi:hypothetical protein